MKEHLIAFSYGVLAVMLLVVITWNLLTLVGQEVVVLGLLLIIAWGLNMVYR